MELVFIGSGVELVPVFTERSGVCFHRERSGVRPRSGVCFHRERHSTRPSSRDTPSAVLLLRPLSCRHSSRVKRITSMKVRGNILCPMYHVGHHKVVVEWRVGHHIVVVEC